MNKEEILIALKEIHARYCIPASEQNYTDKDYACMQYEKLIIHLQKEIGRLNNLINELEKYCNEEIIDYDKAIDSKILSEIDRDRYEAEKVCFLDMLDKLKALKENNNE